MRLAGVRKLTFPKKVDLATHRSNNAMRRQHMCRSKNQYDTETYALKIASSKSIPLRAYECPYCFKWHLTSKVTY